MPKASIAEAIVFAVYIPPQEPAPGMALASISASSASSILLFALARRPLRNTETTSSFWYLYDNRAKWFRRKQKSQGGQVAPMQSCSRACFLSQPPIATTPSKPWQPTTVSMESAMTSRDTSEYFMPSVPIEIPSEIVIVLKTTALPLAWLTLLPHHPPVC